MLHLNLKLLLQMHCELYLNKIYLVNLLLLVDFEEVPALPVSGGQHFFNFPPIMSQCSSTNFKDRWIFFSLIKKNIVGGKNAGCDFRKCQNMSNADTTQGFH